MINVNSPSVNNTSNSSDLPVVEIKIKNRILKGLIDSGANKSCIDSTFKDLGEFFPNEYRIRSFNGSECTIFGAIQVKLNFCPFSKSGKLAVVTGLNYD